MEHISEEDSGYCAAADYAGDEPQGSAGPAPQEESRWQKKERLDKELIAMSRDEYDRMMVAKFPDIFADRNKPMSETCMCWGFDVGPGWHVIIHDACEKLSFLGKAFGLIVVADQIKEKFGTLRFYHHVIKDPNAPSTHWTDDALSMAYDVIDDVVSHAERKTENACEECGEHGDCVTICGWVSTLCDKHRDEREAKRNERLSPALPTSSEETKGEEAVALK